MRSQVHVLLGSLLVRQVQEEDAGQGADQEDDVEPAVVEVELQLPQDLSYNGAVLKGHAHTHEQHRGDKVHALREAEKQSDITHVKNNKRISSEINLTMVS